VADRWFYTHEGKTHGPVSTGEIKRLAAAGGLLPTDLLWPEGGDRRSAVLAETAIVFEAAPPARPIIPDWLGDIAAVEGRPATAIPEPPALLDWLEDVRQLEGQRPPAEAPRPPEPATLPAPPPAPAAVPVPSPSPPPLPAIPAEAAPLPPPAPAPPPAAEGQGQTGLDPATGQILDPALFERWLRQQSLQRQKELASRPTATIEELFEQARRELERWVDLEENKPLILSGDLEALRQDARLRAILRPYECWGAAMTARLLRYLEFLVENRRRFYQAYTPREDEPS
jgi:hypothetical protein